jgi:hypothetical protein
VSQSPYKYGTSACTNAKNITIHKVRNSTNCNATLMCSGGGRFSVEKWKST